MVSRRRCRSGRRSITCPRPCPSALARRRRGGARASPTKTSSPPRSTPPTCSCWPTAPPPRPHKPTAPADVLVLANVAAPAPEQAERLGQLVRGGMGLMIFTGAKLDVGLYNDLLHRDVRLLPYPLKTLVDETFRGVIVEPMRPSPIEA